MSRLCTQPTDLGRLSQLLAHLTGSSYPWGARLASGRPINAVLNDLFFFLASDIDSLRYLRLLAVIGVAGAAWTIYLTLRYVGWEWWQAICASLIVASLPPFQVYVSYALTASYPVSIPAAAAALYFAELSIAEGFLRKTLPLASILLLSFAVLNYQPAAMFFWVLAAIVMFAPNAKPINVIRRFLWYLAMFVPAMGVEMCAYIHGKRLYGTGYIGSERAIGHDFLGKVRWFLHEPLKDALNLANLFPTRSIAIVVVGFVTVGLFLYFQGRIRERLANIAVAGALIPLSYTPNLVVAENWSSYRTQVALTSLIAIYVFLSINGFIVRLLRAHRGVTANAIMFAAASLCLFLAAYHVQAYFAVPQSVELELMRQQLAQQDPAHTRLIYIIGANSRDSMAPGTRYDEFGIASAAKPWAPGPQTVLLLRSMAILRTNLSIRVIVPEPLGRPTVAEWLTEQSIYVSVPRRKDPPPGAPVVDMRSSHPHCPGD